MSHIGHNTQHERLMGSTSWENATSTQTLRISNAGQLAREIERRTTRSTTQEDAKAHPSNSTTQEEAISFQQMTSQRQVLRSLGCGHEDNASASYHEYGRLAIWTRQRAPLVLEVPSLQDVDKEGRRRGREGQ